MANQTNLTQEQIEAINNYSGQIKQLKDFQTGIRSRSGMYIGSLQNKGFRSQVKEIFQNSVDQLTDSQSPCNWIYFFYNQNTLEVIVEDNGLGIPAEKLITILTTMHTSKNFEKTPGKYTSGFNGMGLSVVCALSTTMIVETYKYDGTAYRLELHEGYPKTKAPVKIPNKSKKQGTKIYFIPDTTIMGEIDVDWKSLYKFIKLIMSLTPLGSAIDFEAIDSTGASHKEKIINKDGIITDLIMKSTHPMVKPIICFADNGICKVEVAFCFDSGGKDGPDPIEDITSFANWSPTTGGTHTDGCLQGICKFFTQYMNNIFLASNQQKNKKNPLKVTAADIKTGLKIVINAAHLEPEYSAQAKEVLSNPDMLEFATNTVIQGLQEWAKNNPNDLLKLCKYFKDIAELRVKQNSEKVKIVNKYQSNAITGYPEKYVKPIKQRKEFMIVEGDSALSSATDGRDINSQGIYGIRGKLPNAFRTPRNTFLANEEIQGIIKIVTGQDASKFDRKFDPYKDIEWEKIIFMTDADRTYVYVRKCFS